MLQWFLSYIESTMDLHVFPIPIPPPTSLSTRFLWVFPVHQARAFVSCIQPFEISKLCVNSLLKYYKSNIGRDILRFWDYRIRNACFCWIYFVVQCFFFFLNQYIIFFVSYKNFFREFHFKDDKLFFQFYFRLSWTVDLFLLSFQLLCVFSVCITY